MFAQLQSIDADWLKNFVLAMVGLAGVWAMLRRPKTTLEPQPLEVRAAAQLVSKQECELMHRATVDRVQRIEADMAEQNRNRRQDVSTLHDKIREVGESVSAVNAAVELQNQRVAQIDAKLDRMIERR